MYTHTINKLENGKAYITLHNDTGETETYTEQVTVSEAVFATETTPFIPPVYEIVEHTRPRVINTDIVIDVTDEAEISTKVQNHISGIENPVSVNLPQEIVERNFWLEQWAVYKKAKNAMQELADAGFEPTEEETTRFNALKNWVGTNRKPEYSQYM